MTDLTILIAVIALALWPLAFFSLHRVQQAQFFEQLFS